ncbi:hypothetical protein ID866_3941 [Astraeus odoratus]|nr:hypothetical protein ID866_3941 [Astraeus odoratus]
MITITVNGRSTQAQIMDECPGCPYAGLDFSEGLFKFFADESAGVLYGSWVFGSGAPATTSTPTPTPTTTWQPPTTTSLPTPSTTWSPPPTTTSTSSAPTTTTTWSTSSAIQPNTTVSDSIAVETPIPSGEISSSILAELSLVMVNMGEFLFECDSQ